MRRSYFPSGDSAGEGGEEAAEAAVPVGEQIHVLNLAADAERETTVVQPHRNEEDFVERQAAGAVERVAKFRLERSLFAGGVLRETSDKKIGHLDGLGNRARPILSRQKLLPVEPRVEAVPA